MATFRSRSRSRASTLGIRRRPGSPLPAAEPRPFFAAIEDLNRGNVPSNDQLKVWIQFIQRSFNTPTGHLSESGKALVRDVQELMGLLTTVVDERNRDELIQRFFIHARLAGKLAIGGLNRSGKVQIVKEPRRQVYLFGSRDTVVGEQSRRMRKEVTKEVRSLYRLVQLMIASPDVRNSITQVQEIVKIIFPEGIPQAQYQAQYQAGPSKADQEQPARARHEKSVSFEQFETGAGTDLDKKLASLRGQVRQTEQGLTELERTSGEEYVLMSSAGAVQVKTRTTEEGEYIYSSKGKGEFSEESTSKGYQEPTKYREESVKFRDEPSKFGEEPSKSSGIRRVGTTELPEISSEQAGRLPIFGQEEPEMEEQRVPEKKPLFVEEPRREEPSAEQYGGMSEAEKRDAINRIRELFRGLRTNKELQKTIADAYKYVSSLQALSVEAARDPTGPIPGELQYEENIKAAQRDLLKLMERFAGGASLKPLIDIVADLRGKMATDYELKDFFGDWRAMIRRCLEEDKYLDSDEFGKRTEFLLNRTQSMGREKYGQQFNEGNEALQQFINGWQSDPLTGQIGRVLQRIFREDLMATGQQGGFSLFSVLKPDLMQDFRNVIIPSMLSNLHEIPLPRIESISNGNRLVLENIVIPAGGFMPVDLDIRQSSSLRMNPREKLLGRVGTTPREKAVRARSGWHNALRVRMAGMHTEMRDVRFEIDKVTGWPKLHDDGLADMRFAGRGMSISINLLAASASKSEKAATSFFGSRKISTKQGRMYLQPTYVRVKISRLALHMHDTRRDWMYKLMNPFIRARVKRAIETSVRDQIVSSVNTLDSLTRGISSGLFSQ